MKPVDVIIVGGGITGLSAAYRLQKDAPELKVVLLEASDRLGGKIWTQQEDGFVMEAGPDCFLARKERGVALCAELGIADQLIGRNPDHQKTFVKRNGRLHRLPEGLTGMIPTNLDALRQSTLLSAEAQAAVAQEPSQPARPANGDESVANFIIRRLGQETFENLIEPLMGGIYAGQADLLSLAATFPQLRQLELTHGSLLAGLTNRPAPAPAAYPPFVSLPGGMNQLVNALVVELSEVMIRLNAPVVNIEHSTNYQVTIEDENGAYTQLQAAHLILTTPAFVSARLLGKRDATLATALGSIPYASTALVNLAFREADLPTALDGYGYVIPRIEGGDVLACTWSSRKWHGRSPDEHVLLRVYIGRFGNDVTAYEDGRLINMARQELANTLNIRTAPLHTRLHRWPNAMPQYNLGHLDRIETIREQVNKHPGLYLAGNYFHGVGIPDCIGSGETAAEQVKLEQQRSRSPS